MGFGLSDEQLPLRYAVWRFVRTELAQKAARLLIWRAAANSDQGLPSILDSSSAKSFANHVARCVTGKAVQLMGGDGYSAQNPMERRMHDAWGGGMAVGAIDFQQVNIASAMIGRRFDQKR
ncbi:acyl-CoA dehydrogenase family protein [Blastomonas fulva]|uniref:acyl-CoA dehydrogenase family protein n=1 Tax=Blastomonas fulva TaxID=1550728 RepID=UPI003F6EFDBA